MFIVYILKSDFKERYYIGHTDNLDQRLNYHNSGKVLSTKPYKPWRIIHTESLPNKQEAYKREMQIKSYKSGNAFKKLITQ